MNVLEAKEVIAEKMNSGLSKSKATAELAENLNVNFSTLTRKLNNEDNSESVLPRTYSKRITKNISVKSYKHIIVKNISENPQNIKDSFRKSIDDIYELSGKLYSIKTVSNYWYGELAKEGEVFKIITKHKTLTNTKNIAVGSNEPKGIRKIINTAKSLISAIFS